MNPGELPERGFSFQLHGRTRQSTPKRNWLIASLGTFGVLGKLAENVDPRLECARSVADVSGSQGYVSAITRPIPSIMGDFLDKARG